MRGETIGALLVVAIIAGAGAGYLVGNINERTTTLYSSVSFTRTITLYTNTTSASTSSICTSPPLIGCGPVDEPVILSARVYSPGGPWDCAIVNQSSLVTCLIVASGGDSGTVVMNLTSLGGNSSVAFGTYSSEGQYVHYNSTYSCLYTTTLPDFNSMQSRCLVSESGSTYRFYYSVAQDFPQQQQVVLTITVLKTCCWP